MPAIATKLSQARFYKMSVPDRTTQAAQDGLSVEQGTMQPVLHTVEEGTVLRCYLTCGHVLTLRQDTENPASPIECWACEAAHSRP